MLLLSLFLRNKNWIFVKMIPENESITTKLWILFRTFWLFVAYIDSVLIMGSFEYIMLLINFFSKLIFKFDFNSIKKLNTLR
jgi:hypothetical protein